MSGQLRLPAVRAFGRRCLRPQVPSAAGAFGRKSLRPAQLPSAMPRVALLRVNRACAHGQRSSAVVAVVRGRSDAPGKSTESTRSLAPSAQRLPQSCLSCSCQLPTRRNAIISIYRSSAAALHTQPRHTAPAHSPGTLAHRHAPRHTGTPARSPAHKYTGCCRVISITFPSFPSPRTVTTAARSAAAQRSPQHTNAAPTAAPTPHPHLPHLLRHQP